MSHLPTVLIVFAFLGLCILLFFARSSKDYEEFSKIPLDDDVKDRLSAKNKED